MKKLTALLLTAVMVFAIVPVAFAADVTEITNPYANVNWDTVNTYKTGLHSHTNLTDGSQTMLESIERHAETGFDVVAITDHGAVNYSWTDTSANSYIHGLFSLIGKSEGDLENLSEQGTFANGVAYTYGTAENGDDYLTLEDGHTILRVPYGIENNAVSVNAHVNSWFADYSDNSITTYEDAVKGVDKAGGLSVINHPGEYTKARYELHSDKAYNESTPAYAYYINKYATLLDKYDSCLGIDINSKGDLRTEFDRVLWDKLLSRFSAKGKTIYAICSSDAHQLDKIDTGYVQLLAEEKTSTAVRNALENGEFFGASHCIGNPEELYEIADALYNIYGETEVYNNVKSVADEMSAKVEQIEKGQLDADEYINMAYSTLDEDGYETVGADPKVTSISVENGTITINSENSLIVRFISDGKLVTTLSADNAVFNVADYEDVLGDYVRAEIFGEGGILYVQPFLLNASEKDANASVTKGYVNLGIFDFLLAEIHNLKNVILRFFTAAFVKTCG